MSVLFAMVSVLLAWLVLGGCLLGYGLAFRRLVVREAPDEIGLFASFWLGVAACVGALHVVHFFTAISAPVGYGILGVGLGLCAWRLGDLRALGRWCLANRVTLAWVAGVVVWLANRAIGPGNAHDSGLYHFNVIRWTNDYAIVPGIANLAGPLGMNQSSLLLTSAFNHGPLAGLAHHVVNSLLVAVLATQVVPAIAGLVRRDDEDRRVLFLRGLLAAAGPAIVMIAVSKDISSPKTDLSAGLAVIGCSVLVARRLVGLGSEGRGALVELLAITLLATLSPCLKLSTAPTALGLWVLGALTYAWPISGGWVRRAAPGLAVAVVASLLLIGPWLGRSAVLSGHPLFPTRVVSLDVPWRVPDDHVTYLKDVIAKHGQGELPMFISSRLEDSPFRAIARLTKPPFEDRMEVSGVNWVRAWFFSLPFVAPIEVVLPAGVCVVLGVVLLVRRRGWAEKDGTGRGWWVAVPLCVGLVAWVLVAPVGRYAWPLWWALSGVMAGACLAGSGGFSRDRRGLAWMAFGTLVVLVPLPVRMGMVAVLERRNPITSYPLRGPGANGGFHATPSVELGIVTTRSGLEVWAPMPSEPELVWDSPLPACAWPPVDLDLVLRDPSDMGSGFEIRRGDDSEPFPPRRHRPAAVSE